MTHSHSGFFGFYKCISIVAHCTCTWGSISIIAHCTCCMIYTFLVNIVFPVVYRCKVKHFLIIQVPSWTLSLVYKTRYSCTWVMSICEHSGHVQLFVITQRTSVQCKLQFCEIGENVLWEELWSKIIASKLNLGGCTYVYVPSRENVQWITRTHGITHY